MNVSKMEDQPMIGGSDVEGEGVAGSRPNDGQHLTPTNNDSQQSSSNDVFLTAISYQDDASSSTVGEVGEIDNGDGGGGGVIGAQHQQQVKVEQDTTTPLPGPTSSEYVDDTQHQHQQPEQQVNIEDKETRAVADEEVGAGGNGAAVAMEEDLVVEPEPSMDLKESAPDVEYLDTNTTKTMAKEQEARSEGDAPPTDANFASPVDIVTDASDTADPETALLLSTPRPDTSIIGRKGIRLCPVAGCSKMSQGRRYLFFCAQHCTKWLTLHPQEPIPLDSPILQRGAKRVGKNNSAKGEVEVEAENILRPRKRSRLTKLIPSGTDTPVDNELHVAMRLSLESTNNTQELQLPAVPQAGTKLFERVVKLTPKGREQLQSQRKALGVEPHLYFVLTYDANFHSCELVPMREGGIFSKEECTNTPECLGRPKWVLFSEDECGNLSFQVSGDYVEVVPSIAVANTMDANDEQWHILSDGTACEEPPGPQYKRHMHVQARDEGGYYEARIEKVGKYVAEKGGWQYRVHYIGWGRKYDRILPESDLAAALPRDDATLDAGGKDPTRFENPSTRKGSSEESTGHSSTRSSDTLSVMFAKCTGNGCPASTPTAGKSVVGPCGEEMWQVERVRGRRWNKQTKKIEYLAEWAGCDRSQDTWEPQDNFSQPSRAIFDRIWTKGPPPKTGREEYLQEDALVELSRILQKEQSAVTSVDLGKGASSEQTPKTKSSPTEKGQKQSNSRHLPSGGRSFEWTPVNECILLWSSLENPDDLISLGAGDWMIGKSQWEFEGCKPPPKQIRDHWEVMLERQCRALKNNPGTDYALHVYNAAFVLASGSSSIAKNMALLAAGWHRVGTSHKGGDEASWFRPALSLASFHKMSNRQYVDKSMPLDKAWGEHLAEIRDGIERAWVPTLTYEEETEEAAKIEEEKPKGTGVVLVGKDKETTLVSVDNVAKKSKPQKHKSQEPLSEILAKGGASREEELWLKHKSLMTKRKTFVLEHDPRPSLTCCWCGPAIGNYAPTAEEIEKALTSGNAVIDVGNVKAVCKACRFLEELGWSLHVRQTCLHSKGRSHQTKLRYTSPSGQIFATATDFLSQSTSMVEAEFSKNHVRNIPKASPAKEGNIDEINASDDHNANSEAKEEAEASKDPMPRMLRPNLPNLSILLTMEKGLATALEADKLHVWNANYGSNSTIALTILRPLVTGKLPHAVKNETPFFRPQNELNSGHPIGSAPPTRFLGVTRVMESVQVEGTIVQRYTGQFGVEFPLFDITKQPLIPESATVGGRKVLIRNDLTEDVAGKLYVYIFRLLYGSAIVERCLKRTNALSNNATFVQDVFRAFNVPF